MEFFIGGFYGIYRILSDFIKKTLFFSSLNVTLYFTLTITIPLYGITGLSGFCLSDVIIVQRIPYPVIS